MKRVFFTLTTFALVVGNQNSFAQNNPDCQQISLNNQIAVSNDSTTITAVETSGNYQWVRADQNNAAIGGATLSTFSPQQTGVYAVRITSAECPTVSVVSQSVSMNKDDMEIAGNLNVAGDAKFVQDVGVGKKLILDEITTLDSIGTSQLDKIGLLVRDGNTNGEVKRLSGMAVSDIIYQPRTCFAGSTPTWANGPDKLYSLCGNVGIGTNNPTYKLHVAGQAYTSGGILVGNTYSPSSPALIQGYHSFNNGRAWMRFTVNEGGEDKTAFLIEKDGGVFCTSVRVRLREDIPVPDFVFKKDYPLMPLSEVKAFVQTNSHLPGIPSENQIRKEGLNVEEMQLKLLQKVEELTLYVIELDEENKKLKEQVRKLTDQK